MTLSNQKAQIIGQQGEDQIASILSEVARCYKARLFRNLYIPCGNRTVEIDAVLVASQGIIVFELKNIFGQIQGSVQRYEWTVTVKGKRGSKPQKYKIYSPLKQNLMHVRALSRLLNLPETSRYRSAIHACIVFTSRAELKKVPPNTQEYTILQTGALLHFLSRFMRTRKPAFTAEQVGTIVRTLAKVPNSTKRMKQTHVTQAKDAEKKRLDERERRRKARTRR